MKVDKMATKVLVALFVCLFSVSQAQYYGHAPPTATQQRPQVTQTQNQNTAAWRQWYQQQQQYQAAQAQYQKQLAAYNAAQAAARQQAAASAQRPQPIASTAAATSRYAANYYRQNQARTQPQQQQQPSAAQTQAQAQAAYASRYQQAAAQRQQQYRQQQQQQQQPQPQMSQYRPRGQYGQQPAQQYQRPPPQYSNYRPPQNNYVPPPRATPPPTTTPIPGEIEIEYEVPTTTTTAAPRTYNNQWGHYSQGYGGQYGGQQGYQQQQQPQPHQQGGYNNNYYQQQPHHQQQQPPQHQNQPQPHQQGGWNQAPPPQDTYGPNQAQGTQPGGQDPFGSAFDVNGLKPTIFNPQYQQPPPQQQPQYGPPPNNNANDFAGIFGQQNPNPAAPQGKTDFGSRGPNPIQMNQFLSQATAPKEQNALPNNLDALLGKLLQGTANLPAAQKPTPKPTTKAPPLNNGPSLVSERLNDFVLGPQSQFRSNAFSEIPTNNAHFDSLNPLDGFIGQTPAPPTTTTPEPPGRNGDFLAGFIGVNKGMDQQKAAATANDPPNIYFYNYMNEKVPTTQQPQANAGPVGADAALGGLGTQELSAVVQKLLGVLAAKQAAGGQG